MTDYAFSAGSAVDHADHIWEEWHAYLSADVPADVDPNAMGICCHTCRTVVIDSPVTDFVITECPDHGVKVCSDRASFVHYVAVVREGCRAGSVDHLIAHIADGTDCWTCCGRMVIDPYGILD